MGDFTEKRNLQMSYNIVQIVAPKLLEEDGHQAAPSVCRGGALRRCRGIILIMFAVPIRNQEFTAR